MRSAAIALLAAAALARADAPTVIKAAPLEIQVRSARTGTSFPVYTGSGTAIRAADGEMAGVIVARDLEGSKTANYLRAALTADAGRTLVKVGVDVVNGGKAPLAFRFGDLSLAPGAVLMAIGEGEHPFTKDEAVLGKIKGATREIPAGDKLRLVYVYSVKNESAPGKLVYKGKQGVELKGVAQPAA